MIKKSNGKYNVFSEDGKTHLGGPYDSEEEAQKRLREVEWFKMHKTSDQTAKINIAPADGKLQPFLDTIKAHQYEYKNPQEHGQGTFVSPMAQELLQTDLGKSAVIDDGTGTLKVDYGRLGGITLAATAFLNQRMNQIQSQIKLNKKDKK
jgi:hypothetical protein